MKRSRLKTKLRLLPITMAVAFLALGLKVGEVIRDGREMVVSLSNTANAESAPEASKSAEPTKNAPATPEKGKTEADTKAAAAAPAGENAPDAEDDEKKSKREFSQIEVDLLQSLAQRRQELDGWSKQVQLKENMLIATEQRINEKIDNLQKMKKDIEDLLALYNEQEDTKIRSLVKIYENMKPKDAARIFEELDMPVLLIVVDKMSERKVSPILANMTPSKAKDLTVQLAEQRKLQKPRANAAAASAADVPAATGDANAAPTGETGKGGQTGSAPADNSGGATSAPAAEGGNSGSTTPPPAAAPEKSAEKQ